MPLTVTDRDWVAISATTPGTADVAPKCWNVSNLDEIYELPENAIISIDDRKITITGPLDDPPKIGAGIIFQGSQRGAT